MDLQRDPEPLGPYAQLADAFNGMMLQDYQALVHCRSSVSWWTLPIMLALQDSKTSIVLLIGRENTRTRPWPTAMPAIIPLSIAA